MSKYQWIRKPDFTKVPDVLEYNRYWEHRGWTINKKLNSRESIALDLIPENAKVIDMGCGTSMLPVKLKEKGVDMTVSDVSDKVLTGYSNFGISGVQFDLEKLDPTALTQRYDYMILFEVLEHLRYPEEVIKHLSKHTKNFLITVPNSAAYYYRFGLLFNGRFFTQWVYHPSEHLRYWSHIDFVDWLEAMGLKVEKTIATDGLRVKGFLPGLPNLWKNLFADRVLYHCSIE
jgi:methionine biosynthesis protein MetW